MIAVIILTSILSGILAAISALHVKNLIKHAKRKNLKSVIKYIILSAISISLLILIVMILFEIEEAISSCLNYVP